MAGMTVQFTVTAELKHVEGKFAARHDLTEQIAIELEGANPESLEGEGGGSYEVTSWEVTAR